MTVFIPSQFQMLSNIYILRILMPSVINIDRQHLNDVFESFNALDRGYIHTLDNIYELFDKIVLLITVLNKRLFFHLYVFIKYQDINSDGSMIRGQSLIGTNMMVVKFWREQTKKNKIQD